MIHIIKSGKVLLFAEGLFYFIPDPDPDSGYNPVGVANPAVGVATADGDKNLPLRP